MTREEAIKIIQNEYKCVDRECDIEKSCGKCPYMMPTKEPILKAYEMAIKALSQEPTVTSTDEPMTMVYPTIVCDDAISRREALKCINDTWGDYFILNELFERIDKLPPVTQKSAKDYLDMADRKAKKIKDALTVTQKSGKWIKMFLTDTGDIDGQCSECGFIHKFIDGHTAQYNFCPNCGAKMESEDKE